MNLTVGFEMAMSFGIVDYCLWNTADEQEEQLPKFFETQQSLIGNNFPGVYQIPNYFYFFYFIYLFNKILDEIISNKKETRNSTWFEEIKHHRDAELTEMKTCFQSESYHEKRRQFVFH